MPLPALAWSFPGTRQLRHMGPQGGDMGVGYYASAGHEQVDAIGGKVFSHLVKAGLPISFVASTDTLKSWKCNQPLVTSDGLEYDADEIASLAKLSDSGAPIIAIGGAGEASSAALDFFGVRKGHNGLEPGEGTKVVESAGLPIDFIHRSGGASTPRMPHRSLRIDRYPIDRPRRRHLRSSGESHYALPRHHRRHLPKRRRSPISPWPIRAT